jgi:DNA-binding beta-propeller fold protein YncE
MSGTDRVTLLRLSRRAALLAAGFGAVAAIAPRATVAQGGGGPVFALRGDGKIVVIDPASDTIVRTLETGGKGGTLGSLSADGGTLFVANNAAGQRGVTVVDARKLELTGTIETGNRPKHPIVSPDGKLVAVNHSGLDEGRLRIALLDTATAKLVRTVELPVDNTGGQGDASMHGSWSPDGELFAIGSYYDDAIFLVRPDGSFTKLASIGNPHYFDWFGRELWVVVEAPEPKAEGASTRIQVWNLADPAAPVLEASLAMGRTAKESELLDRIEGHHGVFTQDGRYYIVCNRGSSRALEGTSVEIWERRSRQRLAALDAGVAGVGHAYLTPDGRFAVLTQYNDTKLPILDIEARRIVATIDAGQGGHLGHAAFAAGKMYVNNRKADEVLVIDPASWTITKRIQTAAGGQAQAMVLSAPYNVFERIVNPHLA